ncbi:dephospho-CoA kinase [Thalassococcus sp. CAU 1522]|uniref:Dephospho-CoA kinase n=1 Tax=Thalassococcus arenae TaxID=2851652 RepID=A0ABS6N5W2_9RHOB|nr:dephospho-CoA kinase [Thalassococcus arenae]MBV2359407.1 dephospho-CoA kinase [Thalassococcus arenae]
MTIRIGLTGSIGMGKSATAQLFHELGCPVWDADAAVHRLYARGGSAVTAIRSAFPDAVADGAVSRDALRRIIAQDPTALPRIEAIVHPLVRQDREDFANNHPDGIVVFDIPLLFETGTDKDMHATVCVTIDAETQKSRVLDRGNMTEADLQRILARQMPNDEKMVRADYIIETDNLEHARSQVQTVLADIKRRFQNA